MFYWKLSALIGAGLAAIAAGTAVLLYPLVICCRLNPNLLRDSEQLRNPEWIAGSGVVLSFALFLGFLLMLVAAEFDRRNEQR